VLLGLALLGLVRVPPEASMIVRLILVTCASVWFTHALLYFELRHRFALEPLLAVLAALTVSRFSSTGVATSR